MSRHPYETFYIPLLLAIATITASLALSLNALPAWAKVALYVVASVLVLFAGILAYQVRKSSKPSGRGGRGGIAESFGSGNTVTGGKGGDANSGVGGAGGNAVVRGNNSVVKGGDGGVG
jgi:uncharacterized membrane protein YgcG